MTLEGTLLTPLRFTKNTGTFISLILEKITSPTIGSETNTSLMQKKKQIHRKRLSSNCFVLGIQNNGHSRLKIINSLYRFHTLLEKIIKNLYKNNMNTHSDYMVWKIPSKMKNSKKVTVFFFTECCCSVKQTALPTSIYARTRSPFWDACPLHYVRLCVIQKSKINKLVSCRKNRRWNIIYWAPERRAFYDCIPVMTTSIKTQYSHATYNIITLMTDISSRPPNVSCRYLR